MIITPDEFRRRKLDDDLLACINALHFLRSSRYTFQERLNSIAEIQKLLPEIRRMLIYFMNKELSNAKDPV